MDIGKAGVLDLVNRLIEKNPDALNDPQMYLTHLELSREIAGEMVDRILSKYHGIPLVKEEVVLAATLHDIGRPLCKNQLFHELRGAEYIERFGLRDGIADSQRDIYRIAQMIRSHGFLYERWFDPNNDDAKKEFEKEFGPIDLGLLLPRTLQEAIVTYSDDANENGRRVRINEKYAEQSRRYSEDPTYKDAMVIKSIKAGQNRVLPLCEKVEALANGELRAEGIAAYGFL